MVEAFSFCCLRLLHYCADCCRLRMLHLLRMLCLWAPAGACCACGRLRARACGLLSLLRLLRRQLLRLLALQWLLRQNGGDFSADTTEGKRGAATTSDAEGNSNKVRNPLRLVCVVSGILFVHRSDGGAYSNGRADSNG